MSRSPSSPSDRRVACWLCSGTRSSIAARARCIALFTDATLVSSISAVSFAEKPENLAEDQHGTLVRRKVLERGDEGELDALATLVARVRRGQTVLDTEHLVGIGLKQHG